MNFKYSICFFLVAALLFYLSGIPSLKFIQHDFLDHVFRKSGHIIVFAFLTFFLWQGLPALDKYLYYKITLCAIITLGFAGSDELHQYFVYKRSGNIVDFALDAVGISVTLLLLSNKRK